MIKNKEFIARTCRGLRLKPIFGQCIDMVPYDQRFDAEVMRLRSLPDVLLYMNLLEKPQIESQIAWRSSYEKRDNDVMWLIKDKLGRICGTNRLYDIDPIALRGEKGSQIVDPDFARVIPAALESEIIVIKTAFEDFGLNELVATIHIENARVRSMNERFGFRHDSVVNIRGVEYIRYILKRSEWDPQPYESVLAHWAKRLLSLKKGDKI